MPRPLLQVPNLVGNLYSKDVAFIWGIDKFQIFPCFYKLLVSLLDDDNMIVSWSTQNVRKSYYVSNCNQDYHKVFTQLNNVICNEWSILECGFYCTFELKCVLAILDRILPPKNPIHMEVICMQIKQIHCKIGDIKQYMLHTCLALKCVF